MISNSTSRDKLMRFKGGRFAVLKAGAKYSGEEIPLNMGALQTSGCKVSLPKEEAPKKEAAPQKPAGGPPKKES